MDGIKFSEGTIVYRGVPRLGGVGFCLNPVGGGEFRPECEEEREGEDGFGSYGESVRRGCIGEVAVREVVRIYPEHGAAFCYLMDEPGESSFPEEEVGLLRAEVRGMVRGVYIYHDRNPFWTSPLFVRGGEDFPDWGSFLLWECEDGLLGCAVPVDGGGLRSRLRGRGGRLEVVASGFSRAHRYPYVPLVLFAFGEDPYELVERAYSAVLEVMGHPTRKRAENPYPELFEYLGWCSWNAFGRKVDEEGLLRTARTIRDRGIPAKFFLIDDGWQSLWDKRGEERLDSFCPDPEKFPRGWEPLVEEIKACGIPHVGLWHTLQGYWRGIEEESEVAKRFGHILLRSEEGNLFPDPGRAFEFFSAWYGQLRRWGFDFVKVDDQSSIRRFAKNLLPADEAAREALYGLQAAVGLHLKGLINCMAMSLECAYHWLASNVARASDDYAPGNSDRNRQLIRDCVYNALWLSQLAYPDYDMFQTHDPMALALALSRAVSGGPIYVTDEVEKSDLGLIRRLCLSDGRILRADFPALPTRDMLFRDPYSEPVPLKAFTRANEAGVVLALNLYREGGEVEADVRPSDAGLPPGKYLAYRSVSGKAEVIDGDAALREVLPEGGGELFLFAPVHKGFACVGLVEKFLAPKGVEAVHREEGRAIVFLREPGEVLAWCEEGVREVRADGKPCACRAEGGFIRVRAEGRRVEFLW